MIYTVENTSGRGKPIQIYLDDKPIPHALYLDRQRRIIRKFKTDDDGKILVDLARQDVEREEIRYSHRQTLRIEHLKKWELYR